MFNLLGIVPSVLLLIAVIVASFYIIEHLRLRRIINKIPGPDGLPIIGDIRLATAGVDELLLKIWDYAIQYPEAGIIKLWIGPQEAVAVFKAKTVEELLNNTSHSGKNRNYKFFKPWIGDGLLLSKGEKWFSRRKMITPSFHLKILDEFIPVFNEHLRTLVGHLDKMAGGPAFDIQPYLYHCMLDIISDSAMGVKVHAMDDHNSPYVKAVHNASAVVVLRMQRPWLLPDFLFKLSPTGRAYAADLDILHGFTRKVIAERKAILSTTDHLQLPNPDDGSQKDSQTSKKRRRLAFLDMLLDVAKEDPSLTDDGIQEEVDTFMFGGHDSTASAATFLLYMLGCHPEEQYKVQREIDAVLGDRDRDVTMDDINQLKYTDCFIKETLRLYPPAPWYGRNTTEPFRIGGYEIPVGTTTMVLTCALHRDPVYFPDPEKFDPSRWLTDDLASRHPFCYVPFSAGIRNCIGQRYATLELKTVMCHIVRNYNMTCTVRGDMRPTAILLLRPSKPVPLVHLVKRR